MQMKNVEIRRFPRALAGIALTLARQAKTGKTGFDMPTHSGPSTPTVQAILDFLSP